MAKVLRYCWSSFETKCIIWDNPPRQTFGSELPVLVGRFFDFVVTPGFGVFWKKTLNKSKNLRFWVFLKLCDKSKNLSFENSQNEWHSLSGLGFEGMEGQRTEEFHQRTGKEPSLQGRLGVGLNYIYIYIIQILQNTVQLSFKRRFN
jgi:hypothetical protein